MVIGHDDAYDVAGLRRSVLRKIFGRKRCPFVYVDLGRRNDADDGPVRCQQPAEIGNDSPLRHSRYVVESKGGKHEVELSNAKSVEVIARNQTVIAGRIGVASYP